MPVHVCLQEFVSMVPPGIFHRFRPDGATENLGVAHREPKSRVESHQFSDAVVYLASWKHCFSFCIRRLRWRIPLELKFWAPQQSCFNVLCYVMFFVHLAVLVRKKANKALELEHSHCKEDNIYWERACTSLKMPRWPPAGLKAALFDACCIFLSMKAGDGIPQI